MRKGRKRAAVACAAALLVVCAVVQALRPQAGASATQDSDGTGGDWRTTPVLCTSFKQAVRRAGTLKPVNEQHIFIKVSGTIQELAPQGKVVAKDDVVLRLDPRPHEDAKAAQEALIKQQEATFKSKREATAKLLNQAKEDVASYDLLVQLETSRLDELKRGATQQDIVTAQVNVENNTSLAKARKDEFVTLEMLAAGGFASQEELRRKRLDVVEQDLGLALADINQRKLEIIDPVRLADQEQTVREAVKTRDAAKERVRLMERNMQRDLEHHQLHMEREMDRLKDLTENVEKTVYRAPGPGAVVHRRHRWHTFSIGREVWDGQEILALPDFSTMKVALTVDEARIAFVNAGQEAEVTPAGWKGEPFKGTVSRVADKGRDEFEQFTDETTALSGTANRQVFDVEVEVQDKNLVMRPGLRADVQIVIRNLERATVVPRTAIVRDKNGDTVVYMEDSHSGEGRPVKVLAENDFSAVVEGVQPGERVKVVERE